jgi:aminoglycoside phosphotransferase family enzyme
MVDASTAAAGIDEVRGALARAWDAAPEDVVVREAPDSWVLLIDERAYRFHKPRIPPFLDDGTPERRRATCREEVVLNRPLAPDVYRGVRSLAATPEGLVLAAEDDPRAVDYVVEMRRYDDGATLAARLAAAELRDADVAATARALARFHDRAPPAGPAAGPPAPAIERRTSDTVHGLLAIAEQRGEVERLLALERFAHAFVVTHARMLDARARRGRVREGHGDLRAGHVVIEGATITRRRSTSPTTSPSS